MDLDDLARFTRLRETSPFTRRRHALGELVPWYAISLLSMIVIWYVIMTVC